MKTIYLIGGTMGVGKTTTCQLLKKKLHNSVFLDGDWCWDADPFQVTEETKAMVQDNICHLLNNFIHCSAYENIIFCWVMHEQGIIDSIREKLDTLNCTVKVISLVCDEESLRERLKQDIREGKRSSDVIARSVAKLPLYQRLQTIKIDTSNKSIEEVVEEMTKESIMNIYEKCPTLENDRFLLRLTGKEDCDDLLEVYSDKNALPFFNSDNCNGDNFYYSTKERMAEAIHFWDLSYENRWFARLSIIDKASAKIIGTIEVCYRVSEDAFNGTGILRVDVRSDYEKEDTLFDIFSLVTPKMHDMIGCDAIITKAPIYAVERIKAIQKCGFEKSEHLLKGGHDGYEYNGYWVVK